MALTWNNSGKKGKMLADQKTGKAKDADQDDSFLLSSDDEKTIQKDPEKSTGFFKSLKKGLSKTRKLLSTDISELFAGNRKIDDELLEELEELLITSDIGVQTTMDLIQSISKKSSEISDADQLKKVLKEKILALLNAEKPIPQKIMTTPHVIMVIGVNGVGKTTTIGKLAAKSFGGKGYHSCR